LLYHYVKTLEDSWLGSGALNPPSTSVLDHWRMLAGKRPVSIALTDDYTQISTAALDQVMQICLLAVRASFCHFLSHS
jgi:hypothetical protein